MRYWITILSVLYGVHLLSAQGLVESSASLNYSSPLEKDLIESYLEGQPSGILQYLFAAGNKNGVDNFHNFEGQLDGFIDKLLRTKDRFNDRQFLSHLFYKTHKQFLRNYSQYASFDELTGKGNYDCLTGTALYAWILDQIGIDYTVIETNYHIYVIAETSTGRFLMESTDPLNGFVWDQNEIALRLMQDGTRASADSESYYHYSFSIHSKVSLFEMVGLLYYNQAVRAYNDTDLSEALVNYNKAGVFYQSTRMEEFKVIMDNAIQMQSRVLGVLNEDTFGK